MNIAILGASGHIGYSLAMTAKENGVAPFEYARRMNNFDEWRECEPDVIINCAGVGSPPVVRELGTKIFGITNEIDSQVLEYMQNHSPLYIFISSGAVHHRNDPYAEAKREAEARHRGLPGKNIVDLRVYNYFTEFIDLGHGYLITEIVNAILDNEPFLTNNIDVRKDFINRFDLWRIVSLFLDHPENGAYDVYSKAPIGKFELLRFCRGKFGLNWRIEGGGVPVPTEYFSRDRALAQKGYAPQWTSIECVENVIEQLTK